ncbi:MAG: hypothetical protein ACREQQ_12600, partial [Candidatus Binatia bacterium]
MSSYRVLVVTTPEPGPSLDIVVRLPFEELTREGFATVRLTTSRSFNRRLLDGIDLVIFSRNTSPADLAIAEELVSLGIPYIYDIDDNFWALEPDTPDGQYTRHPAQCYALRNLIRSAAHVRVYSQAMKAVCSPLNSRTECYGAYFDLRLLRGIERTHGGPVKIIYATSRRVDREQSLITAALRAIAARYGGAVQIVFWGGPPNDPALANLPNFEYRKPIWSYRDFMAAFYQSGFDIGLAPLREGVAQRAKANAKFRDYGACRIAGVYSAVPPYVDCIRDGETGLLVADDTGAWERAMASLIDDPELRARITRAAYDDIVRDYSLAAFVDGWRRSITSAVSQPRVRGRSLLRPKPHMCFVMSYEIAALHSERSVFFARLREVWANLGMTVTTTSEGALAGLLATGQRNFVVATDDPRVVDRCESAASRRSDVRILLYR